MKQTSRLSSVGVATLIAILQPNIANADSPGTVGAIASIWMSEDATSVPKALSTQTLGSRATVTSGATLYGGFETRSSGTVYLLIRGNSLQTLGITNFYLDAPRVRIYDASGQDLTVDDSGRPGFNFCLTNNSLTSPVRSYYANVRGQPANDRDACIAANFQAGTYTFSVTPSIQGLTTSSNGTSSSPSSGEVLFEITLGPSS